MSVKVFAPATVANVACGFDILGFAVEKPGDEVVMKRKDTPGVEIVEITGDEGRLPFDPAKNTVSISVLKYLEHIGKPDLGIEISLHKKMPFGSGLGSSAASTVAGVVAVNELLGNPLTREELLPFAMEGERIACGAAHADNVAPALYGGFVLIRSYEPLDVIRLNTPDDLYCAIIHPNIEVPTKDAREILRKEIPMKNAIVQWGNVAGLVAGLLQEDYELIGRSIHDVIVEPIRSILIPGYQQVKDAALSAGALGTSISGSGPSIFSLCKGEDIAKQVGVAKQHAFAAVGVETSLYVSKINQQGPVVMR
ncbi:homoserine kinase [Limibacter armeniacum]|uniref:homoserine kinase n=1 Tax=Limibacter armeniacum TaxID=466084 RepID=UPI0038CC1C23